MKIDTSGIRASKEAVLSLKGKEEGTISGVTLYCSAPAMV